MTILTIDQKKEIDSFGLSRAFNCDWYPPGTNPFTARQKLLALFALEELVDSECSVMDDARELIEWQEARRMFYDWLAA